MTVLGRRGVLPDHLAVETRRAVGFRNVLVHGYVAVDDTVVVDRLADLRDLEQFVAAVSEWLPSPTS